jgi:DNA repair photolyase
MPDHPSERPFRHPLPPHRSEPPGPLPIASPEASASGARSKGAITRGRGAAFDPPNRFLSLAVLPDPEEAAGAAGSRRTRVLDDPARSILTRNTSPDVGFDWSLNPYRGCEHGCAYCYARPTHEYLGLSAGLDFESVILARRQAPRLLERALASPRWEPVSLVMSGVTDPYQPAERRLEITRGCLEVLARTRHPVAVITKHRLVTRDADLLGALAWAGAAHVTLSITTLDRTLQRALEPRASPPEHRLEAIRILASEGVPVAVNVAPVIPGLTEHEIPSILDAAARAGASAAGMVLLRLPGAVRPIFLEWLQTHLPHRAERVVARLRDAHGGRLYDATPGHRMRGSGVHAQQIQELFRVAALRAGLRRRTLDLSTAAFRRPPPPVQEPPPQLELGLR